MSHTIIDYVPTGGSPVTRIVAPAGDLNGSAAALNASIQALTDAIAAAQAVLATLVPYSGATEDVDLGSQSIDANSGSFAGGAISLGNDVGTAAWIDSGGSASFASGQGPYIATGGTMSLYQDVTTVADLHFNTAGDTAVISHEGQAWFSSGNVYIYTATVPADDSHAIVLGGDGSASFASGNATIDASGAMTAPFARIGDIVSSVSSDFPFVVQTPTSDDGLGMYVLSSTGFGFNIGGEFGGTGSGTPFLQATNFGVTNNVPICLNPAAGNVLVGTNTDDGTHQLQVNGGASFAGGSATIDGSGNLIPASISMGSGFGVFPLPSGGDTVLITADGYGQFLNTVTLMLQLATRSSTPSAVAGGLYFDDSHIYGCVDGSTWATIL